LALPSQLIFAQGEFTVTPFDTDGSSNDEIMEAVYASCTETFFQTGSTINFVLDGCDAPVLLSMDLLRSSANPFDGSDVGREEILIDPATSSATFNEEGMFVVFCDDFFKTVGGCFTVTSDLAILGTPTQQIPTLGEWGLMLLSVLLLIIGANILRASQRDLSYS
jgi:hypothetical protein